MRPKQRALYNLNPIELNILSQAECEYFAALLMRQPRTEKYQDEDVDLDFYGNRAKLTIETLQANMMQLIHAPIDLALSHVNVIKLLRTAKQLYDARTEASKILEMVTEIDFVCRPRQLVWRFL